jgi:hypothetical protein
MADNFLDQGATGATHQKGSTTSDKLAVQDKAVALASDSNPALQTAQLLQASGLFPSAKNTAGVFTIVQFGKEVGLSPVVALNNVAIISGKLSMSGASMLALAFKHGVKADYREETEEKCTIFFSREGYSDYLSTFTHEDAEKAGLIGKDGDIWKKYLKTMLKWRCVSQGLKMVAPDILAGVYTEDEIQNIEKDKPVTVDTKEDNKEDTPTTDPELSTEAVVVVDETGHPLEPRDIPETPPENTEEKQAPSQENKDKDKASQAQIKKFHVMASQSGLVHYMHPLKKWLAGIEGSGLSEDQPSGKDLNKEFCSKLIGGFEKFSCLFFASPSNREGIKYVFGTLKEEDKRKTLRTISSYVDDLSGFKNISIDAATEETLNDYLLLFLVGIENQEHNRLANKVGKDGMTVAQVMSTLKELGFEPELKERINLQPEKPKEEKKEEEKKADEPFNF